MVVHDSPSWFPIDGGVHEGDLADRRDEAPFPMPFQIGKELTKVPWGGAWLGSTAALWNRCLRSDSESLNAIRLAASMPMHAVPLE
jgi:hypothetical protein